ncbi:MAG TPA: hypothetical protein VFB45_12035 [Pseudolabrys sp.]|nr:hypothetical protein [Pseudolabrys sp.]
MSFIGRIIVICFAVFLASLAAGIAIAIGVLGPQWPGLSGDVGDRVAFWLVVLFASSLTGAMAFFPVLIFIVLSEIYRLRSLLLHAVAGAAALLVAYYGSGIERSVGESIDEPPPPISRNAELAAAAGAVFGLTYWLIAGRNAGRWRERM